MGEFGGRRSSKYRDLSVAVDLSRCDDGSDALLVELLRRWLARCVGSADEDNLSHKRHKQIFVSLCLFVAKV